MSRTTRAVVQLQNVDKVYGNGVVALRHLDLDVGEGEFLSLLGPSGCGKSTVLRLVAGLGEVSGGRIEWPSGNGRAGLPHGDIGFVFQEPTLMPWATVFKNVLLPLKLRAVPADEAAGRVREAIAMVGLDGFERAYPRELSGGMKMRVSIARALVTTLGCSCWTSRSRHWTRSPASSSTTICSRSGRGSAGRSCS